MPIHRLIHVDLSNRGAVDQRTDRHQDLAQHIDADGVAGGEIEVARRPVLAESVRADANGKHVARARVATAIDCAMTEPLDGTFGAGGGDGEIVEAKVLYRHFAPRGQDARALQEADSIG